MQGHRFSRFVRGRRFRSGGAGFMQIAERAGAHMDGSISHEDDTWLAPSVEPSLSDILDEPIVQALMARDSVTRADVLDAVRQAGF